MGIGENTGQNAGENTGSGGRIIVPPSGDIPSYYDIRNFESGTLGALANNPVDSFNSYTGCRYDNEHVVPGGSTQSGKLTIQAGSTGDGVFGGIFNFKDGEKYPGDEIWFRCFLYFPNDFDWGPTKSTGKGIRFKTRSAGDSSTGHIDSYFSGEGAGTPHWSEHTGSPGNGPCRGCPYPPSSFWPNTCDATDFNCLNPADPAYVNEYGFNRQGAGPKAYSFPNGQWLNVEMHVKCTNYPEPGEFRVWVDGIEIWRDSSCYTLHDNHYITFIYLFSYWNGGSPKTQSCWVDSVVISTGTPLNSSPENGFPMIGDTVY